ncbi:MAG: hypothetical protein JW976_11535 [Syntrophaceae bacterium]|nr:hypothetical protein [Syntrophaceae bacterium]
MTTYKNKKIFSFFTNPVILSAITSLIVLGIFSGVLTADFVMWDDDINMFMIKKHGGLSLKNLYMAFTAFDSMSRYGPLSYLNQGAIYNFFHANPFGYHLVNWLFHGLSSGLLFLIIRNLIVIFLKHSKGVITAQWQINITAFLATLCWALHPLRVEPVAWVAGSGHNQALFFILLSTLCYIKAVISEYDKRLYICLIIAAFIFYTVSLLSQVIVITYFAVFFILDIFLFKRIGGANGWWKSQTAKRVLFEKLILAIPAIFTGVISVIVRIKSAGVSQPIITLSDFGLFDRIMQAMYVSLYYIWRHFYPVDLAPVYTTLISFNPQSMPFILSAFSVIALSIVLFIFRKRCPITFALWLSYIILLIPVMGCFEHPHFPVDRYSLVPSLCLSILVACGLISLIKNKHFFVISASISTVIICILSWLSYNQVKIWNNSELLFSHTIKTLGNDPNKDNIYSRLGIYLYEKDRKEDATINFNKALAIDPYHPMVHSYLAEKEYKNNNLTKSIYHYQKLLITKPNDFKIHYRLSELFDTLNKKKEAAYHFEQAVDLQRSSYSATSNAKKVIK